MIFRTFWQIKEKLTAKKADKVNDLMDFKYKTVIETRYADFDMLGHLNNAMYFTYMEVARTKYWKQAILWDWEQTGVVIANASLDYILPIFPKDKISTYVRTSRIGNSSFDLEYLIVKHLNDREETCARGKTICVAFSHSGKNAVPIPEAEKAKMITFEQL